jgi:hypothetical protein
MAKTVYQTGQRQYDVLKLLFLASGHVEVNALNPVLLRQEEVEVVDLSRVLFRQEAFVFPAPLPFFHLSKRRKYFN